MGKAEIVCDILAVWLDKHFRQLVVDTGATDAFVDLDVTLQIVADVGLAAVALVVHLPFPLALVVGGILLFHDDWEIGQVQVGRGAIAPHVGLVDDSIALET